VKGEKEHIKNLILIGGTKEDTKKIGEIFQKELSDHQILSFVDRDLYESLAKILSNQSQSGIFEETQQLLLDEKKYQYLFDHTSNAVFIKDNSKGKYIDANKAAQELCGRSLKEILSTNPSEIKKNIEDIESKNWLNHSERDDEIIEFLKADGEKRIVRLRTIHFKDQFYLEIAQDVTHLVKLHKKSCETERIYKNLINNLPGFVYHCKNDANWTMEYLSDAFWKITGYQPNEIINNRIISYKDLILEEYRDKVWEKVQNALKNQSIFEIKYPILTKLKHVKWLNERALGVFDAAGNLQHIEGFVTDVTESVRFEQVQKTLFKISSSVIHSADTQSLISIIKKELSKVIDTTNFYIALYDKEKDNFSLPYFTDEKDSIANLPAGKTMTKYVVDTQTSLLADIPTKQKLAEEGKLEFKGTLSKIWLGVPLKVENEIIGVLAVQSYEDEQAYDQSDVRLLEFVSDQIGLSIQIKRKEEELKFALEKAEEADKLKTSFLANMSHEIRTPMNGILGFTQLIKEDDISYEERQQFLSIIEKSGNRMLNIINDLIDVSKVDAGLMDINITGVDLFEMTTYIYKFFKPEVSKKGIDLILEHPHGEKSLIMKTDGEKLYAILINLIKNAIKYSKNGKIQFGYREEDEEVHFYVKDNGIGIPESKKKDVFNRFVQLNSSTDPFVEGSGLGLSITKAYIELLEGKIWFESQENVGSQFYFTLPNNY